MNLIDFKDRIDETIAIIIDDGYDPYDCEVSISIQSGFSTGSVNIKDVSVFQNRVKINPTKKLETV